MYVFSDLVKEVRKSGGGRGLDQSQEVHVVLINQGQEALRRQICISQVEAHSGPKIPNLIPIDHNLTVNQVQEIVSLAREEDQEVNLSLLCILEIDRSHLMSINILTLNISQITTNQGDFQGLKVYLNLRYGHTSDQKDLKRNEDQSHEIDLTS